MMSDSFLTISADQLTKAVSLAAAGTLNDLENPEDDWESRKTDWSANKSGKVIKGVGDDSCAPPTLKLLENLSASVSPSLAKLSQLDLDSPFSSLPSASVSRRANYNINRQKQDEKAPKTGFKKSSSRKNYKLLPPIVQSHMRANIKKSSAKTVLQRQLVTLSHRPNLCTSQELKSLPVRSAKYTTNYVLVRAPCPSQLQAHVVTPGETVHSNIASSEKDERDEDHSLKVVDSGMNKVSNSSTSVLSPSKGSTQIIAQGLDSSPLITAAGSSNSVRVRDKADHPAKMPTLAEIPSLQPVFKLPIGQQVMPIPVTVVSSTGALGIIYNTASSTPHTRVSQLQPAINCPLVQPVLLNKSVPFSKHRKQHPMILPKPLPMCIPHLLVSPRLQSVNVIHAVSGTSTTRHIEDKIAPIQAYSDNKSFFNNGEISTPVSSVSSNMLFHSSSSEKIDLSTSTRSSTAVNSTPIESIHLTTANPVLSPQVSNMGHLLPHAVSSFQEQLDRNNCINTSDMFVTLPIIAAPSKNQTPVRLPTNLCSSSVSAVGGSTSSVTSTLSSILSPHMHLLPESLGQPVTTSVLKLHPKGYITSPASSSFTALKPVTLVLNNSGPCPATMMLNSNEESVSVNNTNSLSAIVSNNNTTSFTSSTTNQESPMLTDNFRVSESGLNTSTELPNQHVVSFNDKVTKVVTSCQGIRHSPVSDYSDLIPKPNQFSAPCPLPIASSPNSHSTSVGAALVPPVYHVGCVPSPGLASAPRMSFTIVSAPFKQQPQVRTQQPVQEKVPGNVFKLSPGGSTVPPMGSGHAVAGCVQQVRSSGVLGIVVSSVPSMPVQLPISGTIPAAKNNNPTLSRSPAFQSQSSVLVSPKPPMESVSASKEMFTSTMTVSKTLSRMLPGMSIVSSAPMDEVSSHRLKCVASSHSHSNDSFVVTTCTNTISTTVIPHTTSPNSKVQTGIPAALKPLCVQNLSSKPLLFPTSDKSKLILSPASVQHLQSMMRKQGITEGYFVITSPRVAPPLSTCGTNTEGNHPVSGCPFKMESHEPHTDENHKKEMEPPSSSYDQTFPSKRGVVSTECFTKVEDNIGTVNSLMIDEERNVNSLQPGSDRESENVSSPDSRSSSAALVIETGEDEYGMDVEKSPCHSSPEPMEKSPNLTKEGEQHDSPQIQELSKHTDATAWDSGSNPSSAVLIPQSPLSLSDLVRQQQNKLGFGRTLDYSFVTSPEVCCRIGQADKRNAVGESVSNSEDFVFPAPMCPTPVFISSPQQQQQQQSDSFLQQSFQHSMYTPQSIYSGDLTFDSHLHTSAGESSSARSTLVCSSNQDTRELISDPSSKSMSDTLITSPKSPLSTQVAESAAIHSPMSPNTMAEPASINPPMTPNTMVESAAIHPPMTPNTMLINLLNRVPTPLLTNHQDLLSAPSASQEQGGEESPNGFEGRSQEVVYSGKSLECSRERGVPPLLSQSISLASSPDQPFDVMSRNLTSGTLIYGQAQSALDLIASNYTSHSSRGHFQQQESRIEDTSGPSIFIMQNDKVKHFSSGIVGNQSNILHSNHESNLDYLQKHYSNSHKLNPSESSFNGQRDFHCGACAVPLTFTINLEPARSEGIISSHLDDGSKSSKRMLETYGDSAILQNSSLQLQEVQNGGVPENSNLIPQKSADTDILRHLILNTSSSSFQNLAHNEAVGGDHRPFDMRAVTFDLSSHPSGHQEGPFDCHVNGSFMAAGTHPSHLHKDLSGTELNESESYRSQDNNFLQLESMHPEPSSEFNGSNTSFKNTAYQNTSLSNFDVTANNSFHVENRSSLGPPMNPSYIMSDNLADGSSYEIQDLNKDSLALPHHFLGSDQRLQHLSEYSSEGQEDTLYYHHQSSETQQSSLHHFHTSSSHPNDNLTYHHMDSLPAVHQDHAQYSGTSLTHSHQNSSTMYSEQPVDAVGYLSGQYPSQFYTGGDIGPSGMTLFSQHCAVGSEAPVVTSTANLPCNVPFSSAPTGLQLEFRYPNEDDLSEGDKQPVMPSASFSPPSVADQAAMPDPGGMANYNGNFQNLSVYDIYMRGGASDARTNPVDAAPESGNFCVECNIMYKTQCKFHPCDYSYVSDTPILSHARLTLPMCLRLGASSIVGHTNNTGVYAREQIPARTKFGPLIGSSVSCDKLGSTRSFSLWQTFLGNSIKVVDTSDENSSNWLMFIKPARVSAEQNLIAFQHGSCVFFVTSTTIESGQEMLYWFAKDYTRMLGITAKPKTAHHQLCPHCPVCKQVFPDRKQVRSHIRLQHPKPCTHKCSHCPRRFSKLSHLNAHVNSVHLRVKKFVCPNCGKHFSDSSNLKKHIKSHSDERLFKCRLCSKEFRQKAHLQIHMNTHMPVKSEQCGFCGERFSRAFSRKQHELQHTKQNKIQCVHCEKVFYKQQVYKEHLKIHRNQRDFQCLHCGKAFRNKAKLNRHGPACKQRKRVSVPPPQSSANQTPSSLQGADYIPSERRESAVGLSTYHSVDTEVLA